MRLLIGARCVLANVRVTEPEALEICTPAVMAVDCSRDLANGKIRDELVRVMELMADCSSGVYGNSTLIVKTCATAEWTTLTGDAVKRGIANIARRLSGTNDGELYITVPGYTNVEIYKITEV